MSKMPDRNEEVKEITVDLNNLKQTGFSYVGGLSTNTPLQRICILRNNYCFK